MNEEKAVFIAYNQAHEPLIHQTLQSLGLKGYSQWQDIQGRGSNGGVPHLGTHIWPTLNNALLVILASNQVQGLLAQLRKINEDYPQQGLRAFVWNIEDGI